MSQMTLASVRPLVTDTQVQGQSLQVTFRCPVSGTTAAASAPVVKGKGSQIKDAMSSSLWRQLRWTAARMMRSLVGGGAVGYAVQSAVSAAVPSGRRKQNAKPSEAEVDAAIMVAWGRIQSQFAWSEGRYISAHLVEALQTDFDRLIGQTQLTERWDRAVLARMLAEIAAANGDIDAQERQMFGALVQGESVESVLVQEPLSVVELDEVSQSAREPLLLMAHALAYTDESIDAAEHQRLAAFAAGMGVTPQRAAELDTIAREHLINQTLEVLYADGRLDSDEREQVLRLAARIGVSTETVKRIDVRLRKRKGLF